jgi:Tfp pilus assembly protein PilE
VQYKLNKAISLLEVLVAVAIIATAITVVFNSFTASISVVRLSESITRACLLAGNSLWEIEQKYSDTAYPLVACDDKKISCNYEITDTAIEGLKELKFSASWQQKRKEKYSLDFSTYLLAQKK